MTRKTISVTEDCFAALEADKREGESWTEFLIRLQEPGDGDVNTEPNTVVVENVDEVARRSAEMVEDRMARR